MTARIIKRQSIIPRIDGIQHDYEKLKSLAELPLELFQEEDNFVKAQFYLRRALEGILNIGSHILTRIPGSRITEYKQVATRLGELGIVDRSFADSNLKAMAGYRNRLTHFYADVTHQEIYSILKNNLEDIPRFLSYIKRLLDKPEIFNLKIE